MNLDEAEPAQRKDFRRVAKQVPLIRNVATGKYDRYRRSSSAGKILDDETGLIDWKIRTTIYGAAYRPDLMAQASTLDPALDKKDLRDIAEECLTAGKGNQRRETGTAIHRMLDHVDEESDWEPAPQFADAVNAYRKMKDDYGLVPVDIECHCVNDQYRLAGTMDRRYRLTKVLIAPGGEIIPIGTVIAGDTKTGQSLEYAAGSYATQLAAYVASVRYDVETDERTAFDPPTYPDWALIIHVVDGRSDLYFVDLEEGRKGLALADQVRQWRSSRGLILPVAPPAATLPPVVSREPVLDAASAAARLRHPSNRDLLGEVGDWLRARVGVIRANDVATQYLLRTWPADVPGLKGNGHTADQLNQIEMCVSRVESEFSIPFPDTDPRMPKGTGPRKGSIARPDLVWPDPTCDEVAKALAQFRELDTNYSDGDVTELLIGTMRAMGYLDGIDSVGQLTQEDASHLLATLFAITADTAVLMYDDDGNPLVRVVTNQS